MAASRNRRIEVIQNIPSPYRLHLFEVMAEALDARGIEFFVHFLSRGHAARPSAWRNPTVRFPHRYWSGCGVRSFHLNPGLIARLWRDPPEVLVIGSTFDTITSAIVATTVHSRLKVAWSEGNTATPGRLDGLLGRYKRWVFKHCERIAVPGRSAVEYVALHQTRTRWRMPEPVLLPNLVDERRFSPREAWEPAEIRAARRVLLGESEADKICICPARLERVKGLQELVERLPSAALAGWKIVIFGQGSLREELLTRIAKRGLSGTVEIRDYVPYAEMPKYYAASDLFLLPSRHDPNPLSVVEALHSGLPVALTTRAGNYYEALEEGVNGWSLDVDDAAAYTEALRRAFVAPADERVAMGQRSKERARANWSSREAVTRFLDALGLDGDVR
ncbi:MAG: glycosyltransferase family 4 protein [Lentisphaerae bacterium]|nr:glycosyltransferase family 4 protein [Lentisphaerota bacterium]